MFCPKCGKEVEKEAQYCESCGNELINEENRKPDEKEKFNIDTEGFVRKPRDDFGIVLWIIGGAIAFILPRTLPSDLEFLIMVFWPVSAYIGYLAIKKYSSHDIETWKYSKHTKLWIYVGCLLAGIAGIIVYYFLKGKERKYIAEKISNR